MNEKQFIEKYCYGCGTQRCEGPGTEWFEGCQNRWNLDGVDAAAEVKRLNDKVMELAGKLMKATPVVYGKWEFNRHQAPNEKSYFCSICAYGESDYGTDSYCPNCGAKMNKEN